jgi:hypothetical protein
MTGVTRTVTRTYVTTGIGQGRAVTAGVRLDGSTLILNGINCSIIFPTHAGTAEADRKTAGRHAGGPRQRQVSGRSRGRRALLRDAAAVRQSPRLQDALAS